MIKLTASASRSLLSKTGIACVLLTLAAACGASDAANPAKTNPEGGTGEGGTGDGGPDGGRTTIPTVVSATPASGGTDVALNSNASATFSEPMDGASLTTATFTVASATAPVAGRVVYGNSKAVFWPSAHLAANAKFTATITTGAKSASGIALAANYSWTFTTGTTVAPGLGIPLGTAGSFVILSKSGISTEPASTITGDLGVSPAAATYITGFGLAADASNVWSITPQVTGKVFASDYAPPTPSNLTTAIGDMEIAFTDASARAPDVTELGAGDIGGKTLIPGVYKWGTGLLIPTDVTLAGSATDVWVFQIAQNLTVENGIKVVLGGGAQPKNIFWQVAGAVDVGTTAHLEGVVLCQTAITMKTGSSINGRLLGQTAVTLAGSTVVQPAQ